MPTQVVPIEGIDKSGFIADTPAVSLPQGAWSNVANVRFRDGAIRKIAGHEGIFTGHGLDNIRALAYWENPEERQYVVINAEADGHHVYTVSLDSDSGAVTTTDRTVTPFASNGRWQIVQFNGGYTIVINNGVDTPHFITANQGVDLGADTFLPLPGWDSYLVATEMVTSVRAGIIVAAGNVLAAGDLTETRLADADDVAAGDAVAVGDSIVVRTLDGIVRVSDVAEAGAIPQNWNPFDAAVGTADEIIIADTGRIRAMATLRGQIFVFTSDTIHALQITPQGLRTQQVSNQYGAVSQSAVFEFRGQLLIIGSDDIYLFSGNPGDIKSIADGRVRRYFYNNISAEFYEEAFIQRDQAFDELWICYPTLASADGTFDEALIWNYQHNTFTKRQLPRIRSLTVGPIPGSGSNQFVYTFTGEVGTGLAGTAPEFTFTIDSTTSVTDPGFTREVQVGTFVDVADLTAGEAVVQTATGNAGHSNIFSSASESHRFAALNNFHSGTGSAWSYTPDGRTTNPVFTGSADSTFGTDIGASAALLEMRAEISTVFPAITSTGDPVVVADEVPNFTVQFAAGQERVPGGGILTSLFDQGITSGDDDSDITTRTTTINTDKALFIGADIDSAGGGNWQWVDNAPGAGQETAGNRLRSVGSNLTDLALGGEFFDFVEGGYRFNPAGIPTENRLSENGSAAFSMLLPAQPGFMDIVRYTGIGSESQAINHDLGEKPAMMIIKAFSSDSGLSSTDWAIYHEGLDPVNPENYHLTFGNAIRSESLQHWGSTEPTATQFTVGDASETNHVGPNTTYVSYLFANNPDGNVICDSYDWTIEDFGQKNGFLVPLPWKPEVLWIKNTNGFDAWILVSSVLGGRDAGQAQGTLNPGTRNSGPNNNLTVTLEPEGFRIVANEGRVTGDGNTFIYMAMRSTTAADAPSSSLFYTGDTAIATPTVADFLDVTEQAVGSGSRELTTGQDLRGPVLVDNSANEMAFGTEASTGGVITAPLETSDVGGGGFGTHTWIVPDGITSISVVAVGAGGTGGGTHNAQGGGGGALAYRNNVPVVPGDTITAQVGQGGLRYGSATTNTDIGGVTLVRLSNTGTPADAQTDLLFLQANPGLKGAFGSSVSITNSQLGGGITVAPDSPTYAAYLASSTASTEYTSFSGGRGGTGHAQGFRTGGGGAPAGWFAEGPRGGQPNDSNFEAGQPQGGGGPGTCHQTGTGSLSKSGGGAGGTGTQGVSAQRRQTATSNWGGGWAFVSATNTQATNSDLRWSWPGEGYAGGTDGRVALNPASSGLGGSGGFPGGGGGGSNGVNISRSPVGGNGQVRIIWGTQTDGTTPRQFPDGECETITYDHPKAMSLFIPWRGEQSAGSVPSIWDTERGNLSWLRWGPRDDTNFRQLPLGLGMRDWGPNGPIVGRGAEGNVASPQRFDLNMSHNTTAADLKACFNFVGGDTFDVVKYVGSGNEQVVPHALGADVAMIWIKNLDHSGSLQGEWAIWHRDQTATNYHTSLAYYNSQVELDGTSISVDATTGAVSVSGIRAARTGDDFVMYLFADVPALGSAMGSFTGQTSGIETIDLGFKPAFVMLRSLSASAGSSRWLVFAPEDTEVDADGVSNWNVAQPRLGAQMGQYTNGSIQFNGNEMQIMQNTPRLSDNGRQVVWFAVSRGFGGADDTSNDADFALYDSQGNAVSISQADRTTLATTDSVTDKAATLINAVNTISTPGVNWVASSPNMTGDVEVSANIWAGTGSMIQADPTTGDMIGTSVGQVAVTGIPFTSVVDNSVSGHSTALVGENVRSGLVGHQSIEFDTGTTENVLQVLTITEAADSNHAFIDEFEEAGSLLGVQSRYVTTYTPTDPSNASRTSTIMSSATRDAADDIVSDASDVQVQIVDFINDAAELEVPVNYTAVAMGNNIVATAALAGTTRGVFDTVATHGGDSLDTIGTLEFPWTATDGLDVVSNPITVVINQNNEAGDTVTQTIVVPARLDPDADTNPVPFNGDSSSVQPAAAIATHVVANDDNSVWDSEVVGDTVVFTQASAFNTQGDFSGTADGVDLAFMTTATGSRSEGTGITITVPGDPGVSVTNVIATVAGNTGVLNTNEVATEVARIFSNSFTDWRASNPSDGLVTFTNTSNIVVETVGDAVDGLAVDGFTATYTPDPLSPGTGLGTLNASQSRSGLEPTTSPTILFNARNPEEGVTYRLDDNGMRSTTRSTPVSVVPLGMTADISDITGTIANYLTLFTEFTSAEDDTTTGVSTITIGSNQFGPSATTLNQDSSGGLLNVIQTTGTVNLPVGAGNREGTLLPGQARPAVLTERFAALVEDVIERPWANTILNEARNFLVTGGGSDIYAMDLGNDFDGQEITSFVERRNFQLEPLVDTEMMTGVYMNTDSTADGGVTFSIDLQRVSNSSVPIDYSAEGQTYPFNTADNYKVDTRIDSRLLNMKIEDTSSDNWEIQTIGLSVGKGGTR